MPKNWNHLLFPKLAENTESPYFSRKKCRCYFDRRKTGCFTYTRQTHSKEIIKRFIPRISGLKWEENRRRMLTWAQWSLFGALASSWSTRLSQNDVTLNWNMIRIGLFQYFFLYFFFIWYLSLVDAVRDRPCRPPGWCREWQQGGRPGPRWTTPP